MSAEKLAAFNESWNAMARQAFRANQQLAMSFMPAATLNAAMVSGDALPAAASFAALA
jgi:hypothetical protein